MNSPTSNAPETSIKDLPTDSLYEIFSFLTARDLLKQQSVCKEWAHTSNNEELWKRSIFREWQQLQPSSNHMITSSSETHDPSSSFQQVYRSRLKRYTKWRNFFHLSSGSSSSPLPSSSDSLWNRFVLSIILVLKLFILSKSSVVDAPYFLHSQLLETDLEHIFSTIDMIRIIIDVLAIFFTQCTFLILEQGSILSSNSTLFSTHFLIIISIGLSFYIVACVLNRRKVFPLYILFELVFSILCFMECIRMRDEFEKEVGTRFHPAIYRLLRLTSILFSIDYLVKVMIFFTEDPVVNMFQSDDSHLVPSDILAERFDQYAYEKTSLSSIFSFPFFIIIGVALGVGGKAIFSELATFFLELVIHYAIQFLLVAIFGGTITPGTAIRIGQFDAMLEVLWFLLVACILGTVFVLTMKFKLNRNMSLLRQTRESLGILAISQFAVLFIAYLFISSCYSLLKETSQIVV